MRKPYIQARNTGNNFALVFKFSLINWQHKAGTCISVSQVFLPPSFSGKGFSLLQLSRKRNTFHLLCTANFLTPSLTHLIVLVVIWLKTTGWRKTVLHVTSLYIFDTQKCRGSNHYLDYNISLWCVQNI